MTFQKKYFLFFAPIFLCTLLSFRIIHDDGKVTTDQAAEYNDKIIYEQKAVDKAEGMLIDAMANYADVNGMKKAHADFLLLIKVSTKIVKNLKKFDGENYFAKAAVVLFKSYNSVAKKEYIDVIKLYSLPDEKFTEKEEKIANGILEQIEKKLDTAFDEFVLIQKKFAKKYDLELVHKD